MIQVCSHRPESFNAGLMKFFLEIITYLMAAILLISAIYSITFIKKLTLPFVFFSIQLSIASVLEITGLVLNYRGINNGGIYNFQILIECCLLLFSILGTVKNQIARKIILSSIAIFISIWLMTIIYGGLGNFAVYTFLFSCFLLSIASLYVIMSISGKIEKPLKQPYFWLCASMILYFGPIIPLFSMFHYFETHGKMALGGYLYTINDLLAILRYCLAIYGFYLFRLKEKSR